MFRWSCCVHCSMHIQIPVPKDPCWLFYLCTTWCTLLHGVCETLEVCDHWKLVYMSYVMFTEMWLTTKCCVFTNENNIWNNSFNNWHSTKYTSFYALVSVCIAGVYIIIACKAVWRVGLANEISAWVGHITSLKCWDFKLTWKSRDKTDVAFTILQTCMRKEIEGSTHYVIIIIVASQGRPVITSLYSPPLYGRFK